MEVVPPPITRRTKFRDPFVLPTQAAKRGRPALISDDDLNGCLTHLVGFFEYHWARVAWDLQQAHSIPGVRTALSRAGESVSYVLEPFVYEKTRKSSGKELRESRQAIRKLEALSRSAYDEERQARERLDVAAHALETNPEDQKIQKIHALRTQRLGSAVNQSATLLEQLERKRQFLREQEAYFAQSQLLDFLKSVRYRFTPVAFAKAMAGLPLITWRQSAERCARLQIHHPYAAEYESFTIVQKAFGRSSIVCSETKERVRAFLSKIRREDHISTTLKNEWYYLRESIDKIYATTVDRSAIPFRVYAEYQRRKQSRSAYDRLMEEDEKIN